jgi:hypothetical protein
LCACCPFGQRCEHPPISTARFDDVGGREKIVIEGCPRHWVNRQALPLGDPFAWYLRLKDGVLPEPGGLLDQPAYYVAVITLLDTLVAASRQAANARQQSQAEKAMSLPHGGFHVQS